MARITTKKKDSSSVSWDLLKPLNVGEVVELAAVIDA